jgi:hypothetical protein
MGSRTIRKSAVASVQFVKVGQYAPWDAAEREIVAD